MMADRQRIEDIAPLMDEISPTFCMAKWHHTTIYLHTGETHSCYHPAPHAIDIKRIGINPSALHNTAQKKSERRQMMAGGKPEGCNYCWNTTDPNGRILRRKTKYHCPDCQANLCIVPCFQAYHEALEKDRASVASH